MSLSLTRNSNRTVVSLPYDIINVIFDYLSQITESGWFLEVDNHGKVRLYARRQFTAINNLNCFKQTVSARYVQLIINFDTENDPVVNALEQPYLIQSQEQIENNYLSGFTNNCRCYNYVDPFTERKMVAYVETRMFHDNGMQSFTRGCVYDEQGHSYIVSAFGFDEPSGTARIYINPVEMTWDFTGVYDEEWDENDYEAAHTLLDIEQYFPDIDAEEQDAYQILFELGNQIEEQDLEDMDINDIPQLQMYM